MCDRIKQLRMENGLTRDELAGKISISSSALGNYERGEREPSAALVVVLAEHFDVTSDYILGLSENPKNIAEWPQGIPDDEDVRENIQIVKESIENMLSSAHKNSFGSKTFDAYVSIINLLPDIDRYAGAQLADLQLEYPEYKMFGAETELRFDGMPLLYALAVDPSDEATRFAKRHPLTVSHIQDKIDEIYDIIGNILQTRVFDAIKGLPLEKQPAYIEQIGKIKQALNGQHQASGTKDETGCEEYGEH